MKNQLFASTLALGVSMFALAVPAMAQDPATAPAAQQEAPEQQAAPVNVSDIVVTGSRIVRDGYTAPTPVTVATTEELARTTPSSIPDALNKLPQFNNSLSPSKSALNFSNAPIHGNVLNLRGLGTPSANPKGPLRTLILFDGMRVSPTEYVGTIDTNVLPQLLMQRVDVVTGGASAQWGSDAVAGVVNFILDKKFTGIKGVAQAGISARGDNGNQRLGLAYGRDFAGDRGHIIVSGEYSNSDGMLRSQRDFANVGYNFVGSVVGCTPPAGQPTTLCSPGGPLNPYTIGTDIRISALAPSGRITASSVTGNPFVGQVINPDGTTRPFNTGTPVGTTGFQSGGDGYKIPTTGNAIAPLETYTFFGRLSYDLTDDISAFVQGSWSRTNLIYSTQVNALVPPSQAVSIFKGNPYLTPALDASLPTANDYITIGKYDAGQPAPIAKERTDYWMVNAGLNGKLAGLNWTVTYSHGDSVHTLANSGLYENQKLYAAADAVINPANGQITCRVLLDPTLASRFAGCQPIDLLHGDPSASTPAGYAYATGTSRYRATIRQDGIAANLSGSLFDLPAGPIDFAVGVEYRKQKLRLTTNADPALLDTAAERSAFYAGLRGVPAVNGFAGTAPPLFYWLTNVGSAEGSLNVKEAYAELAVPILKDTAFFRELSVNGAARITDYSTSGTVKTWKVGATWKPVDDLLLRATLSRDIRAPNLFELYAGAQSGIGIVDDRPTSGLNQNVPTVTSGNPNLTPEKAKTLTIGGVFTPSFLRGFSLSLDYYRIKVTDLIDTLSAQQIVTNCTNAGGSGVPECSLITRATPTSLPSLVSIVPANIAFLKTSGIDIDASYRTALGNGALGLRLYLNYLQKFDAQQYAAAPIAHYAGVNVVSSNPAGFPRWRGNLSIDYTNGPFGVTIAEQYIHKMRLDIPGGPLPIQFIDDHVKAVWYTDLAVRFTIPHGDGNFELFGNVNNLFDKKPPLIPGTVPGVNLPTNIAVYDFIGRAFTAGVRFRF
ncbi:MULTISPECIES: TonB-dependent receptor domain-containing protein [Sphingobium]|uniref:TonB-dependent receptor domain-containing protein n=1 Tax=Sphingobium tyrosinilyticum TaxID=2715436 RepID=A0ABV9F2I6_9SPHN|nr:TonB-dependent receptor [Sphingobium sp. EP60837]ANI76508.1 Vitamin B12 transporter BtuB [Sphingobium sp. EP60837]